MAVYKDTVIKEFEKLGSNEKYRVRLLKDHRGDTSLDIREYIESDEFTGFTRKGVRLGWSDIQIMLKMLPEVEEIMDKEG